MEPAIAPEMVAVIPRPEHTVRIVFADGEVRDVDITPLLDTPAFSRIMRDLERTLAEPGRRSLPRRTSGLEPDAEKVDPRHDAGLANRRVPRRG